MRAKAGTLLRGVTKGRNLPTSTSSRSDAVTGMGYDRVSGSSTTRTPGKFAQEKKSRIQSRRVIH